MVLVECLEYRGYKRNEMKKFQEQLTKKEDSGLIREKASRMSRL